MKIKRGVTYLKDEKLQAQRRQDFFVGFFIGSVLCLAAVVVFLILSGVIDTTVTN